MGRQDIPKRAVVVNSIDNSTIYSNKIIGRLSVPLDVIRTFRLTRYTMPHVIICLSNMRIVHFWMLFS